MKRRYEFKSQMNIVPLIDVSLVITIVLMVIAPFLGISKIKVDLPQAKTNEFQEERQISVILTDSGELSVDEKKITWNALSRFLSQRLKLDPNSLVLIKVDRNLPYQKMEHLLDIIKESGAGRIALATEQKKNGQ